jgi:hypothetical protein
MYKYEEIRPRIFEEQNQEQFLKIRDNAQRLLRKAGAVQLGAIIRGSTGDSWIALACVDRLLELGEIKEIPTEGAAQHRVFVSPRI